MTVASVLELFRQAVWLLLTVAAPLLGISLAVGFLVSLFQATTQINEQTLTFVPKMVAVLLALLLLGPWMLQQLVDFTSGILGHLGSFVG
ncbi:MAG: flagellar biosynthesis protein FliQ [Clostridia bacterium]|nr:flagellar biosynthesis protein FliQ [Clostridia bacterium]MCL6520968.1 flagellar biosynthesis protein FliQ [Bacillota bacterium]